MFIPLIRFLINSLVPSSFLVLLRYSFLNFFFHLRLFDGVRFQYFQVLEGFVFSEYSDFSWFGSSIPSIICRFPLFIMSMAHFSLSNSIPISYLYVPTACNKFFNSFSFLENSLMSSVYIWWLTFSCDSWSLYSPVHFLRMWFSGIIAITHSNVGRFLSGFSPQLSLFLLQSVLRTSFSWYSR